MEAPRTGVDLEAAVPTEKKAVPAAVNNHPASPAPQPHQNGTNAEKCPEDIASPIIGDGDKPGDAEADPPRPTIDNGPENLNNATTASDADDGVKTVSLNNENDDRVDSIEVIGQGAGSGSGGASTATTTSTTTTSSGSGSGSNNNEGAAVADPKDLEQSTTSKASDPATAEVAVDAPETIDAVAITAAGGTRPAAAARGGDAVGADNGADKGEVAVAIAVENGRGDSNCQSSLATSASAAADDDGEVTLVESAKVEDLGEKKSDSDPAPHPPPPSATSPHPPSAIEPEQKDVEEGPVTAESVPEEEAAALFVGEPRTVEAVGEDKPGEGETMETAGEESEMDTLQLDESQEEVVEEVLEEGEEVADLEDLDGVEGRVKQETSAKSGEPEEENEIETIDIDTDDDEESLVGPPIDEEGSDDDEDLDGMDEEDEEDVASVGEEYEEFEVSDEENEDGQELQEISGDTSDEERFAAMKESQRGAKRKTYEALQDSDSKGRRVEWLDSGNSPRMHVMESVCRDAMLRHNPDKIEEINSQDEEASGHTDVAAEAKSTASAVLKANVLNRPEKIAQNTNSATGTTAEENLTDSEGVGMGDTMKRSVELSRNESSQAGKGTEAKKEEVRKDEKELVKEKVAVPAKEVSGVLPDKEIQSEKEAESKDCDKPTPREKEVLEESKETAPASEGEEIHSTEEGMEVDSHDGEFAAVEEGSELPKETESLRSSEKVESEKRQDALSSDSKGVEEKASEEQKGKEKSTELVENTLKRKLSANLPESSTVNGDGAGRDEREEGVPAQNEDKSQAEATTAKKAKLPESAKEQLQRELEANYGRHDRLLREYINKSSTEAGEGVQKQVDVLVMEIEELNDMIRTKEMEWNNMIHLKKVKEELVLRLTRKKHVQDIQAAPLEQTVTVAQASIASPEVVGGGLFSGSSATSKAAAANSRPSRANGDIK